MTPLGIGIVFGILAIMVIIMFVHAWLHWYNVAIQEQERSLRLRRRLYNAYIEAAEWRQMAEELGDAVQLYQSNALRREAEDAAGI